MSETTREAAAVMREFQFNLPRILDEHLHWIERDMVASWSSGGIGQWHRAAGFWLARTLNNNPEMMAAYLATTEKDHDAFANYVWGFDTEEQLSAFRKQFSSDAPLNLFFFVRENLIQCGDNFNNYSRDLSPTAFYHFFRTMKGLEALSRAEKADKVPRFREWDRLRLEAVQSWAAAHEPLDPGMMVLIQRLVADYKTLQGYVEELKAFALRPE